MRIKIGDKVYRPTAADEVSLKDIIMFDTECVKLGLPYRWKDFERISAEFQSLTPQQVDDHPDAVLVVGVTVWIARRLAGEDVTFGDALDIAPSKIQLLEDPEDHRPGKSTAAARKKAAKKGSKKPAKKTPSSRSTASAPPAAEADPEPSLTD